MMKKKSHASELYASLSASSAQANSSDFETISLRVSHRTAAMIQALNIGFQQPVLTLFTDRISQHLAQSLLGSLDNEALIAEEVGHGVQPDSAVDLLIGIEAIKYDDAVLKGIRGLFQKAGE